jgi:hypothetical protein
VTNPFYYSNGNNGSSNSINDAIVIDDSGHCNEPDIDNLSDYNYVVPFFLVSMI